MDDEQAYFYYYVLRMEARKSVVDALNRRIKTSDHRSRWRGITLASVNEESVDYARREWSKNYSVGGFQGFKDSWERLNYKFKAIPSHFNIAVWQSYEDVKVLQGMALGKPSRGKTHLTINWLERSYVTPYFRGGVMLPILACAEQYAKLLRCERVLVKDAADPNEFSNYGYNPYSALGRGYIAKELRDGTTDGQ
ncbi:hypothetical protein LQ948_04545 [Jiella sp. MQZ9-1]|uniref:Uncharacterized protein n=1 Tax=Jiella flava TaxID=2816857 RepID=A0A939JRE6_9HYPH|nr:hypothetical protein [Jiella flava]MBO0661833.1 hypothetical protein [Jiella flava]MCD2470473.1 hypothetical protein [Jiella flava]